MKITKNYVDRKKRGLSVEPMLSYDPVISREEAAKTEAEERKGKHVSPREKPDRSPRLNLRLRRV